MHSDLIRDLPTGAVSRFQRLGGATLLCKRSRIATNGNCPRSRGKGWNGAVLTSLQISFADRARNHYGYAMARPLERFSVDFFDQSDEWLPALEAAYFLSACLFGDDETAKATIVSRLSEGPLSIAAKAFSQEANIGKRCCQSNANSSLHDTAVALRWRSSWRAISTRPAQPSGVPCRSDGRSGDVRVRSDCGHWHGQRRTSVASSS